MEKELKLPQLQLCNQMAKNKFMKKQNQMKEFKINITAFNELMFVINFDEIQYIDLSINHIIFHFIYLII